MMLSNKLQSKKSSLMLIGALAMIAGMPAAHAATTTYNVTEAFNQVYSTNDTIFTGSFAFDSATQTVSNLAGSLSQVMSGNATFRQLSNQMSSVYDATLGGLLVTSFFQNSTDVFSNSGGVTGVSGFASGGTKTFGNQNAYATIFVNLSDPTAALTPAQNYKLAYGDCTSGALMGMGTCMTGWLTSTGGTGGTMQGVNQITQTITAAVPEPESYGMMMAGVGMIGFMARRRRMN